MAKHHRKCQGVSKTKVGMPWCTIDNPIRYIDGVLDHLKMKWACPRYSKVDNLTDLYNSDSKMGPKLNMLLLFCYMFVMF